MLKTVLRLVFVVCVGLLTVAPAADASWAQWTFLMGQWVGEGTGQPGEGAGGFSFEAGLQNKVLIRKNYANYPATKDRAAFSHEDLLVVYRDSGGRVLATYWDNEGHVIKYVVENDGKTAIFLSDPAPSEPRYRMTYLKKDDGTLGIRFEIAPPGKPDAFQTYIEAKARRK